MRYYAKQEYAGSSTSSFNNSEDDNQVDDQETINREVIKQIGNHNSRSNNPGVEDIRSADGVDPEDDDDLEDDFGGDQHSCASSVIVPFSQS